MKLSLEHPAWGPVRISDHLRLQSITVCPSTVRNICLKEGMETKYKPFFAWKKRKTARMWT